MADKKSTQTNIRKLTKFGKMSIGLTLPIDEARKMGWKEKQRVVVTRVKDGFTVKDYKD